MCHEIIDQLERDCLAQYGVHLVIHYDPVTTDDPELDRMRALVLAILHMKDERISIHDFRMVRGSAHINLIFDVAIPPELQNQKQSICQLLELTLNELGKETYHTVITFDLTPFQ